VALTDRVEAHHEEGTAMEPQFYASENEYRREQLRDVRRAQALRKVARLRALLLQRRAERAARESIIRAA
jgi:hypothetical protein